jgi:Tfp pilus assembly protein PilW
LSAANTITSITTNAYGDITAYTGGAIAISASQITSGTLATARGGTGLSSFTAKGVFYASDTSTITQAASATEGHILTINASGVPTFAHLSGGTF